MLTDDQIKDLCHGFELTVLCRSIESLANQEKDAEIKSLCAKVDDLEDRLEKARNEALREAANLCKQMYFEEYPDADPEYETGQEYQAIMDLQSIPADTAKETK